MNRKNDKSDKTNRIYIMEKNLLKSILPYIGKAEGWTNPLYHLGKVTTISYEHRPATKEKKPKCILCGSLYENFLLYILHLELFHKVYID